MRRRRMATLLGVIALALVALPGSVGSAVPPALRTVDTSRLQPIDTQAIRQGAVLDATSLELDPNFAAAAPLDESTVVVEPGDQLPAPARADVAGPNVAPRVIVVPSWRTDPEISWYGPGFYGRRTACGLAYTQTILGVAHRSLPCGTKVTFKNGSRVVTLPVIDRGPYVGGRIFDLSAAACKALNHCYTGPIQYRFP